MTEYPHHYSVAASASVEGDVALQSNRLPALHSASPAEFGGPGDRWSPETLLVAAVADCFVLTFRAVAQASKVSWTSVRCEVEGTLDRADRVVQFTRFNIHAYLQVPEGVDRERAERALHKAESACLITNSLKAPCDLDVRVEIG
jgi:organic hydroperoxide reductase OsmC/OhrA